MSLHAKRLTALRTGPGRGLVVALLAMVLVACPESPASEPDSTGTADTALVDAIQVDTTSDNGAETDTGPTDTTPDAVPDDIPDAGDDAPDGDSPDVPEDTTFDADTGDDAVADADAMSDVPTDSDASDTDADTAPEPPTYTTCDAGDEAWVARALPLLLGRQPRGIQEVRVLAQIVAQTSRRAVAQGLMRRLEYTDRWEDWIQDELRVNRNGSKSHDECYGAPMQTQHDGTLATFVRDHPPAAGGPGLNYNMADVVRSSLALDDLSVVWRAHLFAMMAKPLTGANVDAIALDLTRRQDFGEIFEATYLHRNVVCAGCHNGAWGTTDSLDPAEDRHWPLPGRPEQAMYGADGGTAEMTFYTMFRHLGVVGGDARPWLLDDACGEFTPELEVDIDPADYEAYFGKPRGLTASIWQVERLLQQGVDKLRNNGKVVVAADGTMDPAEAFAYLVSQRITNRVWREAMGFPLTLVHYVPRNKAQRDLLLQLTTSFIGSQWSLKTLLTEIVTHPLFNQTSPQEGCGTDGAYFLPPVFNPWTLLEPEAEQANSPGDVLHRHDARLLLRLITEAMQWESPESFPSGGDLAFQKAIGVFVKDGEPGFDGVDFQGLLAFEARFAGCNNPGAGQDWIDLLLLVTSGDSTATVEDVAMALKNRLLTTPAIGPDERPLVAQLMQVDDLTTLASEVPDLDTKVRRFCGVLLQTPQFLLTGLAPDLPAETPSPKLELPAETFDALCSEAANTLLPDTAWTVTCAPGGVIVTPFAPPLGGQ